MKLRRIRVVILCGLFGFTFTACDQKSKPQEYSNANEQSVENLYIEASDYYLGINGKKTNYEKLFHY